MSPTATPATNAILSLVNARLVLDPGAQATRALTLDVMPRDLVLIDPGDVDRAARFADACVGLAAPESGAVRFMGQDWRDASPDGGNAMRGRIGRLVSSGGWVPYLSVLENVLLPQLHHTERRIDLLRDDAARLARQFGLPGVPLDRPLALSPADLQRAGSVRAFLGRPRLIILERATQHVYPEIVEPLISAIRAARDRGTAVLWLSLEPRIWADPSVPATRRLRLMGGELLNMARAA
jgi:phospholipid/cholesterol/gamma-HCH transport system ATP-binding protein